MNNPFAKHTNDLFAARDSVDDALQYVNGMMETLPADHKVGMTTAVMVLINTARVAFDSAASSPEKLILQQLIDARVMEVFGREIDDRVMAILGREPSVEEQINNWARNELDDWIQGWVNDNLDIEDQIQEKLDNATIRIEF